MQKKAFIPRTPQYVNGALLQLRAEIVRGDLDGLSEVETLLRLRGIDPDAHHVPKPTPKNFKRGELTRSILRAIKDQPMRPWDITLKPRQDGRTVLYQSVCMALVKLNERGLVVKEGRVWRVLDSRSCGIVD